MSSKIECLDEERLTIVPDIQRGTFISPDELEAALGFKRDSVEYSLALMRMCRRFRIDTKKAGDPKMIRTENQGLRIMTDEECAVYTPKLVRQHLNSAIRAGRRGIEVVRPDHLGNEQRDRWDQFRGKWSQIEQSARAAANEIKALSHGEESGRVQLAIEAPKEIPPEKPRDEPGHAKATPPTGTFAFGQTWYGPNHGGNRDRKRRRIINIRFGKPRGVDLRPEPEHVWYVDEHGRIKDATGDAFKKWAVEIADVDLPMPSEQEIRKATARG
ncbi:MAG: hypothetical protein GTN69_07055 [Armatimonadetes bacterium]|nr:hypothetical protein [Armatimonadota bacterium]